MKELTNDADKLICYIYKIYLQRRKDGISKDKAAQFELSFYKSDAKLSEWLIDDIKSTLVELSHSGYIKLYLRCDFILLTDAIIFMEKRFQNGLKEVLSFISDFI